jgi:hypothetical protein
MHLHTTNLPRVVASLSAGAIVLASAGFGAVYAASVGAYGGSTLTGLTILFAISLELLKPLAIAQAFRAFSQWQPVRALLLGLLGCLAIAYSLTAELALMASTRGDLYAQRASTVFTELAARERYQRAKDELATLPVRKGNLERRNQLEMVMSQAVPTVSQVASVGEADPGAASLATYLGALGWKSEREAVSRWLTLVPVLALEIGSALAGVLVASFRPVVTIRSLSDPLGDTRVSERDIASNRLLAHLKGNGGSITGSYRKLGQLLGVDKNTLSRAMASLAGAGLIVLEASKSGSVLRLA